MLDEITMTINSDQHDLFYSIMNIICQIEVEISLNNNLVNETNTRNGVHENLQGVVMNEELTDKSNLEEKDSDNALLIKWINARQDKIGQAEVEIDLNNNLVNETAIGHEFDENINILVMNENHGSVADKSCQTEANQCNLCNFCAKNKSEMNRHVNEVHLKVMAIPVVEVSKRAKI